MITSKKYPSSTNVFGSVVKTTVHEEMTEFKGDLKQYLNEEIEKKFKQHEEKTDNRFRFFKDDVLNGVKDLVGLFRNDIASLQNKILAELQTNREEQITLSGQHSKLLNLEDKVDALEKIHPQGQHAQI